MSKHIGKIIKSDSHLKYKCRVYGLNEIDVPVKESDYYIGQFVKLKIFDDIEVVGIVYNSQLFNPDYGNYGPRLTTPASRNQAMIPDFIDETAIILDIIIVGNIKDKKVSQDITAWVIPLNTEVLTMDDQEVLKFHLNEENEINMRYYQILLTGVEYSGGQILLNIINKLLDQVHEKEKSKLKLLQQHIIWQISTVTVKR